MEYYRIIDPVQELRVEHAADFVLHLFRHPLEAGLLVGRRKTKRLPLGNISSTDIGCHDDHRILEIDDPPVIVGQVSFVKHLKQDVEHIRVCLFDFVQQNDRIRLPPNRLCERARILVAHIPGRCANQPAYAELLHVL